MSSDSKASTTPVPLISLEAYISNFFYGLFIQDEDDIFKLTFERNYPKNIIEEGNGTRFTYKTLKDFVIQTRTIFTNRQLVSQSFVTSPSDDEGKSGTVGHVSEISAMQDGKTITVKIVSVLSVIYDTELEHRMITMENFVYSTQ